MAAGVPSIALIGAGRWGRELLRVFDARSRVAQVCHRGSPETRAWLERHYPHVPRVTEAERVWQRPDVEAVLIATPIPTHAALVRAALEAGKHVFVEKPLATTTADAQALTELAARRGRVLFVGHVFLHHPALARIRELIADDPVRAAVMSWQKFGTFDEDLWWNLFPHEIAIAIVLFGGNVQEASILHEAGFVTPCDAATVRLQFGPDRDCVVNVNRCASGRAKLVTLQTAGGRVLSWDGDRLLQCGANDAWESIPLSSEEPLAREAEAFLAQVRAGTGSAQETRLAVSVVETIERLLSARGCALGDAGTWSRASR